MEIGFFKAYGRPAAKMRNFGFVTALIEIALKSVAVTKCTFAKQLLDKRKGKFNLNRPAAVLVI